MAQDYQQDLSELREILSFNYSASDLEDASLEELQDMKADIELYEFLDGEGDNFSQANIRNKEQLLKSIQDTRAKYGKEAATEERKHAPAFYEALDNLLEKFERMVRCTVLPDPLNDWWSYSYEITDGGINLLMNHFSWDHGYGGSYDCRRDETFMLLESPAKLLTVSEYAKVYGVESVTVRQWIRRAKIRSAVKVGREWRIPELAEVPRERGYRSCQYSWSEALTDLPEKYGFLSAFKGARLWQDEEDSNRFSVEFFSSTIGMETDEEIAMRREALEKYPDLSVMEDGVLLLTGKEREELELYMIGNPLIRCASIDSREGALAYSIAEFGNDYGDGFSAYLDE